MDGQWIGFPSLIDCQQIPDSTQHAKEELSKKDSIPAEVIANLYNDVTAEDEISAGDILEIIDVLDLALGVSSFVQQVMHLTRIFIRKRIL